MRADKTKCLTLQKANFAGKLPCRRYPIQCFRRLNPVSSVPVAGPQQRGHDHFTQYGPESERIPCRISRKLNIAHIRAKPNTDAGANRDDGDFAIAEGRDP